MDAKSIALKGFPNYKGFKFSYHICNNPVITVRSYWDGGSRTYFNFVNFNSSEKLKVLEERKEGLHTCKKVELIPGWALVEHSFFCGKDTGLTVLFHSSDKNMLPEKADLTDNEKTVLIATSSYKNSYGGRSNIRFHEARRSTGITQSEWDETKKALIKRGLLLKNGGIRSEGRYAIGLLSLSEHSENLKVKAIPHRELPLHIDKKWLYESSKRIFIDRLSQPSF
ncbi:hypothetical protein DRQ07_05165 [candidate division KSB1 bacterium]|nr:MAG: hypothetical protein DRQ07_05165 [candidate division KSB1 bacterium]